MKNACWIALLLPIVCVGAEISDLDATYAFLASSHETHDGVLYSPAGGDLKGAVLPLSFRDSEPYWGAYVCTQSNVSCAVTDVYNPADYSVRPLSGPAAELQVERVNVHAGSNIYDAAVWQIAVMLGSVINRFDAAEGAASPIHRVLSGTRSDQGSPSSKDAYLIVTGVNQLLAAAQYVRADGKAPVPPRRAVTNGDMFRYNGQSIVDPASAYAYRMTAARWLENDPLRGSSFASLITTRDLPAGNPEYQPGRITWSDWKPVTGENAWAFLLGPLHAAYLHYVVGLGHKAVPMEDLAVRNALTMLPTFAAMQSPSGAVYYAPSGSLTNDRNEAVATHLVSIENNFSVYAGLQVLAATLRAELQQGAAVVHTSGASPPAVGPTAVAPGVADRRDIDRALTLIHAMIDGGELPDHRTTQGLLNFFRTKAWHDGEFLQGGFADDPAKGHEWVAAPDAKAVDVDTWGVAALGADRIDNWFGFGAAQGVWRRVKDWGGYGSGRGLWGVGYSDQDGNGRDANGNYRQGILSGEWTAGAIVMVRSLIRHYEAVPRSSATYSAARQYVQALRDDQSAMMDGIQTLRVDRYASTPFPGKPPDYDKLVVQVTKPYLYASRRYKIPFGWYANPLPSTASSAWILMVADGYDPFGYGGKPN